MLDFEEREDGSEARDEAGKEECGAMGALEEGDGATTGKGARGDAGDSALSSSAVTATGIAIGAEGGVEWVDC